MAESICAFERAFYYMFVALVVLLVMALFALAGEQSRSAQVILEIDLVIIAVSLVVFGYTVYACRRRRQR